MKPLAFTVTGALVTAALVLGPSPAWAQSRPGGGGGGQGGGGQAGTRSSGGGTSTGGSAVSRGDGGGSSGGGTSSSSGGGSSWGGSSGSSGGSVSRPGGARSGGGGSRVDPRSLGSGEQRGEAVPRGARPNTGAPTTGQAVPRQGRPPVPGRGDGYDRYYGGYYGGYSGYYPYGYGYGYYGSPYWGYSPWGFSGLYFYNPFWWGYGYPMGMDDYYYGGYGGYGGGYGYGYGGGAGYGYSGSSRSWMRGGLKLKVKPREAEVYVDGYFIGQVDSFDGTFQQLDLEPGTHRIEIRGKGYAPVSFEVRIDPRETITYRGELQPIK